MIQINNGTPKPQNWIWKVQLTPAENEKLLDFLASFSGDKLKYGEYRVVVNRGMIESVMVLHSTVVEVGQSNKKSANNALENKNITLDAAKKAEGEPNE